MKRQRKRPLKTYEVGYSLTFHNTLEVQARNLHEAERAFRKVEADNDGELDAVGGGVECGYKIDYIQEASPEPPEV